MAKGLSAVELTQDKRQKFKELEELFLSKDRNKYFMTIFNPRQEPRLREIYKAQEISL